MLEQREDPTSNYLTYLNQLVSQGGPRPSEDYELTAVIAQIYEDWQSGRISPQALEQLRTALQFTPETMQGFAYLKPHGYAGDFEIIDRVYRRYHCPDPKRFNWDRYWQRNAAADAVRNRKDYFIRLVLAHVGAAGKSKVLNVASGPGHDLLDLFEACPNLPVQIHCVEQDSRAIAHASKLCCRHLEQIMFHQANALRFTTSDQYDLVWSAGLFDYLDDRLFVRLAARLGRAVLPGGELVIGNFSDSNPSRAYMELFNWVLHHRSTNDLQQLAFQAGFTEDRVAIRREPIGVNLFLHVSF